MKGEQALVPKLRFGGFRSPTPSFLGEVTKWSSGGTPPKDNPKYWGNDIPWISAASMRGSHYSESKVWLTVNGLKNGSKLIKKGGILLLVRGSMLWNCIPVGVAARDLAFNQDVKGIEPSPEVGNLYLLHWFSSMEHRLLNMVVGTGIGAGKLDTQDLKSLPLTIPSLPEQEKIAAFLTSVDDRIDQLKRKKSLLQDYKKGAMQKLFSQELRFKDEQGNDFPDWEEKKLGEIATYRRGSFPQPYGLSKWYDDVNGMPFIQVYDVSNSFKLKPTTKRLISKLAAEQSVFVPQGSIVITIQGSIGRIAITQYNAYCDRTLLIFKTLSESLNKNYFTRALHLLFEYEKQIAVGGTIKTITKEKLTEFKIPMPTLPEQTKIANFLSSLDQKIEQVDTQITQTQTFKKGLLQQMFV